MSPELVLIDPELARQERTRLVERARLAELRREHIAALRVAPAPAPAPVLDIGAMRRAVAEATVELDYEDEGRLPTTWFRRHGHNRTLAFGMLILLATSSLALAATVRGHRGKTREATTTATVQASVRPTPAPATPVAPLKPSTPLQPSLAGSVERRVLTELLSLPSQDLPDSLIDRRTRLLRTNVRATCRRQGSLRFACVVEPPRALNRQRLHVTVSRRGGKWQFFWPPAR